MVKPGSQTSGVQTIQADSILTRNTIYWNNWNRWWEGNQEKNCGTGRDSNYSEATGSILEVMATSRAPLL